MKMSAQFNENHKDSLSILLSFALNIVLSKWIDYGTMKATIYSYFPMCYLPAAHLNSYTIGLSQPWGEVKSYL